MADTNKKAPVAAQVSAVESTAAPATPTLTARERFDLKRAELDKQERELDYQEWLSAHNVRVRAYIHRAAQEWSDDLYIFQFTQDGKWSKVHTVFWDDDAFKAVKKIITDAGVK